MVNGPYLKSFARHCRRDIINGSSIKQSHFFHCPPLQVIYLSHLIAMMAHAFKHLSQRIFNEFQFNIRLGFKKCLLLEN